MCSTFILALIAAFVIIHEICFYLRLLQWSHSYAIIDAFLVVSGHALSKLHHFPAFAARQLTCVRQGRCLFEQLSFTLNSGEILQVVGPNGAGKSSLLRILAGFLSPESGDVLWQDQILHQHRAEFNRHLLFLGHLTGVNRHLSAVENVQYWLNSQNILGTIDIVQLLGRLGLLGLEYLNVAQLSAGQQRKVALARLWLTSAQLWILDEPFTAIDKRGVAGLQRRFSEHLANGGMIILTSHQDLSQGFTGLKLLHLEYRL